MYVMRFNLSIHNVEYSRALASDWYKCDALILNASKTDVMTVSYFDFEFISI